MVQTVESASDNAAQGTNSLAPTGMVEKVALAIYREYENRPLYAQGQMNGVLATELARAAIAALREPTEAMLNGARDWSVAKYGIGVGNEAATGCYQAMIDAALDGGAGVPVHSPPEQSNGLNEKIP